MLRQSADCSISAW